jgi:C_GCAxxG_C_C family probable redox protein
MSETPSPERIRKSAEDAFSAGLFCAESVVLALAKAQGVESDVLPRVATGLCSGMARTRGQCGALTGAIMAVGLALGRASGRQSVEPAYAATRELIREFEAEFGARNCNDLLGCDLGTPEGQATFRERKLDERCKTYTGRATEIAARVLMQA